MTSRNQEIEKTVNAYCCAVGTQNIEDFKAVWTQEETNVLISGSKYFEGIDAITDAFLIGGIQKAYESIELIPEEMIIHGLSEDTAIVIFRYHTICVRRETKEPYGIRGLETQVFKKTEIGWKIAHIQYSGKEIDTVTLEYKV